MDVRVGLWRKLSAELLMLLNCGIGEDSWIVPRTARRSNQFIPKEISPGCWLERLMLKLKLQYFGHLIQRAVLLEKSLMLGGTRGRRRRRRERMRWLDSIIDSMEMSLVNSRSWWWTGRPGVLQFMGSQRVGHNWVTELNWTESLFSNITLGFSLFFFSLIFKRELDYKESWAPKNWCFWIVVLDKTLRVPWTTRRSNQSILKEISPECSSEGLMWSWNSITLATWCKELTHLKGPWCWERLKAEGEGDKRRWDGWMASLIQWLWVRVNSGNWWWTGRPGMLQFMESQRVRHDWATELNWVDNPI